MKDFLDVVKERLRGNHVFYERDKVMPLEEWEKKGEPHVWHLEDHDFDVQLYDDSGYGLIAIFDRKTGELDVGKDYVELGPYVGVSTTYTAGRPKLYKEV